MMLGIDPLRYSYFVRSTPYISYSFGGGYQVQLGMFLYGELPQATYDEFEIFLIEYAVRLGELFKLPLQDAKGAPRARFTND